MSRAGKGVGAFLIHSYLYYILDSSLITDEEFDELCKDLHDRWDEVEHPHKHLIKKEDLLAGSGYAIPIHKYPMTAKHIAETALFWKTKKNKDYLKYLADTYQEYLQTA